MTIAVLQGGLGNQLFQFAAALHFADGDLRQVAIDDRYFPNDKNGRRQQLSELGLRPRRLGPTGHLLVRAVGRARRALPEARLVGQNRLWSFFPEAAFEDPQISQKLASIVILNGYWQHDRIASGSVTLIRAAMLRHLADRTKLRQQMEELSTGPTLCLHVRRGDYVSDPEACAVHGICDIGYYERALRHVDSRVEVQKILVFSDDLEWARANLPLGSRAQYVNSTRELTDAEELCLMSSCRHFIIANSTFSWWAARLSDSPKKLVVAPSRWYVDETKDTSSLIPADWHRL